MFGINLNVLLPVRINASETSEMVTQLLFGELFTVLENSEKWLCVKNLSDGCEGWVDRNRCMLLCASEFELFRNSLKQVIRVPIVQCRNGASGTLYLGMGSTLYPENITLARQYQVDSNLLCPVMPVSQVAPIIQSANSLLGAPYLWGGKSVMGIDCSGLTQLSFFVNGIQLPRDAKDQAFMGRIVPRLTEAQPGDLAFFSSQDDRIIHVGMLLSQNRIIHASGCVRVDMLTDCGIVNTEILKQTHQLHSIRRLI